MGGDLEPSAPSRADATHVPGGAVGLTACRLPSLPCSLPLSHPAQVLIIPDVVREGADFVGRLQTENLWVVVLEKMRQGLG